MKTTRFSDLNGYKKDSKEEIDSRRGGEIPRKKDSFSFRKISAEMTTEAPITSEVKKEREELYEQTSVYMTEVLNALKKQRSLSLDEGFQLVQRIADFKNQQDPLLIKALHFNDVSKFLVIHSVNVAIYAIKLGAELGFSRKQQAEIGMAGLLHEVGMCKIPDEIIYKKEPLNNQEFQVLREHPNYGYELLRPLGEKYAYLAECALQEHERIDGCGYPRGLKGGEIHEYAQIIGLVDTYEALSHSRPQGEKILHFEALQEIIKYGKKCFPRSHLKALLSVFTVFPLHSYVRLNSNAFGKVIETHPDQPTRPKLKIIYDAQGKRVLNGSIINLPESPLLYIVDSVSEEELEELPVVSRDLEDSTSSSSTSDQPSALERRW